MGAVLQIEHRCSPCSGCVHRGRSRGPCCVETYASQRSSSHRSARAPSITPDALRFSVRAGLTSLCERRHCSLVSRRAADRGGQHERRADDDEVLDDVLALERRGVVGARRTAGRGVARAATGCRRAGRRAGRQPRASRGRSAGTARCGLEHRHADERDGAGDQPEREDVGRRLDEVLCGADAGKNFSTPNARKTTPTLRRRTSML